MGLGRQPTLLLLLLVVFGLLRSGLMKRKSKSKQCFLYVKGIISSIIALNYMHINDG